jgi:hypothetical protein
MSQSHSDYDSLLYPKHTSNNETVLPEVKDNSLGTHISQFGSKIVGGATKKRRNHKIKNTIIRKSKGRRFRKTNRTNRRKRSSRRYR